MEYNDHFGGIEGVSKCIEGVSKCIDGVRKSFRKLPKVYKFVVLNHCFLYDRT